MLAYYTYQTDELSFIHQHTENADRLWASGTGGIFHCPSEIPSGKETVFHRHIIVYSATKKVLHKSFETKRSKIKCMFLLLCCRIFLHIVDIGLLSDKWFENIFFHFMGCLFTLCCTETCQLDTVPFVQFVVVVLLLMCFRSYLRSHCQDNVMKFPLCFLPGFLQFQILCVGV